MTAKLATSDSSGLVSVVIPTHNCERYIGQTIESVLAQSHRNLEVIVVDDGSSDRTPEIVGGFGEPVVLTRQSNQRVCAARNRGFELSRGAYVCFLDHDDYWFPWKLQRQLDAFAARPESGVVYTAFHRWTPIDALFPEPGGLDPGDPGSCRFDPEFSGWIYHQFLIDCWALTSTAMIRRDVFEASERFDTSLPYSEDWDLWLRLSRTHPFTKIDAVSTLYRQHELQGSRTIRDIDYRTRLLAQARERWGLTSPDGRGVTAREFERNIAKYHMHYGFDHLRHGSLAQARRAFFRAWRYHPLQFKYAMLGVAALTGWMSGTLVKRADQACAHERT